MVLRILAVLVLVGILAGGAYYFFRDSPEERLARWTQLSERLLRQRELDEAERLIDQVLRLRQDPTALEIKARIFAARGTLESLRQALETYDTVIERGGRGARRAVLGKADVLRRAGNFGQAYGLALSVLDTFPLAASLSMAETARAELDPRRAIQILQRALDHFTESDRERAYCYIARARAYQQLLQFVAPESAGEDEGAGAPGGERDHGAAGAAGTVVDALRRDLDQAIGILEKAFAASESADEQANQVPGLVALYIERSRVRREGETPCYRGHNFLTPKLALESGRAQAATEAERSLGALRLWAAERERDDLPGAGNALGVALREGADAAFLRALGGLSVREASELLDGPFSGDTDAGRGAGGSEAGGAAPESASERLRERRREYVHALAEIARVHLIVGLAGRLLRDASGLELGERIEASRASEDADVAGTFSLLVGLAHCQEGRDDEARRLFDAYLFGVPAGDRPAAALRVASTCHELVPDSPLVLEFVERFESSGGKPFDSLFARAGLLIKARRRPALEVDASRLLEQMVERGRERAEARDQQLALVALIRSVSGPDAAVAYLEDAIGRAGRSSELRRLRGRLLLEDASRHVKGELAAGGVRLAADSEGRAVAAYRKALQDLVAVFLAQPAKAGDAAVAVRGILHVLTGLGETASLAGGVVAAYPPLDAAAAERVGGVLAAYFASEWDEALALLEQVKGQPALQPVAALLGFVEGSVHLLRAGELSSAEAAEESLARAATALRAFPAYPPCQIELASLELDRLPLDSDVPQELFDRTTALAAAEDAGYLGKWVHVKALSRRLRARYLDPAIKNSEIARLHSEVQAELRRVIEMEPFFPPAYIALARIFVIGDELDRLAAKHPGAVLRQLFSADGQRAVSVLHGAPVEDRATIQALGKLLSDQGKFQEALPYFEVLALVEPQTVDYQRLADCYLELDELDAVLVLCGEPARDGSGDEVPAEVEEVVQGMLRDLERLAPLPSFRLRYFLEMRRRLDEEDDSATRLRALRHALRRQFEAQPESGAYRHFFLARVEERRKEQGFPPRQREAIYRAMVAHYEQAVAAFDAAGIDVPIHLLNNLAWYLSEEETGEARERGLRFAERAVKRVPDPADAPTVHDTLAWALHRNERYVEAEEVLRAVIQVDDRPTYRYHLAHVLFRLERLDEALEQLDLALQSVAREFPEEREARDLKAEIQRVRGPAGLTR